jgi:hypothetical protein
LIRLAIAPNTPGNGPQSKGSETGRDTGATISEGFSGAKMTTAMTAANAMSATPPAAFAQGARARERNRPLVGAPLA